MKRCMFLKGDVSVHLTSPHGFATGACKTKVDSDRLNSVQCGVLFVTYGVRYVFLIDGSPVVTMNTPLYTASTIIQTAHTRSPKRVLDANVQKFCTLHVSIRTHLFLQLDKAALAAYTKTFYFNDYQ